MVEWASVFLEGDSDLVTRRLARIAGRVGISWCVVGNEDSSVEVRSVRGNGFVSSGAMAIVSDCAQFAAAVIAPEVSALLDIAVWWQESESLCAPAICAGQ